MKRTTCVLLAAAALLAVQPALFAQQNQQNQQSENQYPGSYGGNTPGRTSPGSAPTRTPERTEPTGPAAQTVTDSERKLPYYKTHGKGGKRLPQPRP